MKKITRIVLLAFLLGLGATAFTGCHTARGFGQDVESTGEAIQSGTR